MIDHGNFINWANYNSVNWLERLTLASGSFYSQALECILYLCVWGLTFGDLRQVEVILTLRVCLNYFKTFFPPDVFWNTKCLKFENKMATMKRFIKCFMNSAQKL